VTDFISADLVAMVEAARQSVADTRSIMAWLRGQGAKSVGVLGFSLGAWIAGIVARSEPDLGYAVLTTPIASIERAIRELPFCQAARQRLQEQKIDLTPFDLRSAQPLLDPRRILLVESYYDLFAPAATIEALWSDWNRPDIWRLPHGHISILMSAGVAARTVHWIRARCVSGPDAG
jgi:hypothetical protein